MAEALIKDFEGILIQIGQDNSCKFPSGRILKVTGEDFLDGLSPGEVPIVTVNGDPVEVIVDPPTFPISTTELYIRIPADIEVGIYTLIVDNGI